MPRLVISCSRDSQQLHNLISRRADQRCRIIIRLCRQKRALRVNIVKTRPFRKWILCRATWRNQWSYQVNLRRESFHFKSPVLRQLAVSGRRAISHRQTSPRFLLSDRGLIVQPVPHSPLQKCPIMTLLESQASERETKCRVNTISIRRNQSFMDRALQMRRLRTYIQNTMQQEVN